MRFCERLGRAQACIRTLDRLAHQFVSHGNPDRDATVQGEPPPCSPGHQGVALSARNPEVPPVVCTRLSRPRKAGVDFRGHQSLPHPEVMLDKQRLHGGRFSYTEFHANDGCSLPCPTKGAGLDHKRNLVREWRPPCTAPCAVFVTKQPREEPTCRTCLLFSFLSERRVQLTLLAANAVPLRLPVANEIEGRIRFRCPRSRGGYPSYSSRSRAKRLSLAKKSSWMKRASMSA